MSEILAGLIGVAVGWVLSTWTAIYLFKKLRKAEAAAKFKESFSEEMALLKSGRYESVKEISFGALVKHEKAVILFEPYIAKKDRGKFFTLWEKYCKTQEYPEMNDWLPDSGIGNENSYSEMTEDQQKENTLSYYKGLLKFATI